MPKQSPYKEAADALRRHRQALKEVQDWQGTPNFGAPLRPQGVIQPEIPKKKKKNWFGF